MRHPILWLALMLAIFFYKEVFLGQRFSPADQLFVSNPWQAVKPSAFTVPSNELRSDETLIAYPHRIDIAGDIKHFGLPLWQEHTLVGSANTFSLHGLGGFAYPPYIGFLMLDPASANTVLHLSIPAFAGLAMYLLLGRLARHRAPRALGALAYALNGYLIVWLSAFPLPAIVAALPLAIYLAWRFLEEKSWLFGVLFAAVLAAVLIFSYPPGSIIFMVLVGLFVGCWWAQRVRPRTTQVLWLALIGLLGIGLAMVAVLPTVQELTNYTSKPFRPPIVTGIPVRFLANWVFPNIAGNPIAHDWRANAGNYCEFVAYDGSLPLILALGGGIVALYRRLRVNPLVSAAVASAVLSALLTYVDPVIRLVNTHPPLNNLAPARWEFGLEFSIAVLAAFALDEILSREGRRVAVSAVMVATALVVAAAGVLIWAKRHEFLHVNDFITQDYRIRLALLLAGVLLLLWVVRSRSRQLGAAAAVAVLFIDLFTFGVNFNPALPANEMYPITPALQYLRSNSAGYRVLPTNGSYTADDLNVYGIDVITGYDHFRDDRYVRLLSANMSADELKVWKGLGHFILGGNLHLDDEVFNKLNVRYAYFVSDQAATAARAAAHWRQVYRGPDGLIYENLAVLPKQFLVSNSQDKPLPIVHAERRPDQDQLRVTGAGRLVWSKPYDRDWKITVNGRMVEAQPYMGYFLSTQLSGENNDVSLSYRPTMYYLGAALSVASLLGLGAIGLGARYRRGRKGRAALEGIKGTIPAT